MNIENELKLIPKHDIKREQLVDVLKKIGITIPEKGNITHQEDTYFDDKEGTLEKMGGSFRIRRKNDKTKITYKIPVKSDTQYKQRKEYEITVPEEYKENINMELAIKLLNKEYPELIFPENMGEILTVINNRDKINLVCQDGTILEMAFDSLKGKDKNGNLYKIQPEIEFETISGNPENLLKVYETIIKEFPEQVKTNTLSKYERTKKEIGAKQLTVGEVSACAILSEILNSVEYSKLQYKGQILHRYDKPTTTNLDNFKDFDYLVKTLGSIKSGQYKVAIPSEVAENPKLKSLLGENYVVKDNMSLEDITCLLLSDTQYRIADEALVNFLNKNYYGPDNASTNRLSHSQQIMLGSGLIAKSSEVGADLEEQLNCMISGLSHDIGHVPMAHTLEGVLNKLDGLFSHELNGKVTIENILEQSKGKIIEKIKKYFPEMSNEDIQKTLEKKTGEIENAVVNHSRKGSDRRTEGISNQAARETDKICYAVSDICDLIRYGKNVQGKEVDILEEEWINKAVMEICKGNEFLADELRETLDAKYIKHLKDGNYGRAVVNAINSIEAIELGEITHYDVNPKIWKFIEKLIDRVKYVREKEMKIEQAKGEMSKAAISFIIEELYKEYNQNNGNIDLAWENLLKKITQMGELDILNHVVEKNKLALLERLKDKEKISPEEAGQIIKGMSERVYEISKIKGKTDEEARMEADSIEADLGKLEPEQVLQYFKKYKFTSEIPITPILEQLHERADIQLKLDSSRYGLLDELWKELEFVPDKNNQRKIITDQYYTVKYNGAENNDVKVKVRQVKGENTKKLIVKVPIKKNVQERMTKKYEVETPADIDINTMLEKLKEENIGLDIELLSGKPYEIIDIIRSEFPGVSNSNELIFTEDEFRGKNGTIMKEIEVKSPLDPKLITKIKSDLKTKYQQYFITESKIDRVQNQKEQDIFHD